MKAIDIHAAGEKSAITPGAEQGRDPINPAQLASSGKSVPAAACEGAATPTRVYIQSGFFDDIKVVKVSNEATVAELKQAVLALLPPGIDASDLILSVEDEDGHGRDQGQATHVKHLKKAHGVRLHLHRCQHVEVKVRFGAEVVHQKFGPGTTIGRVRLWSGEKFGMAPGDVAEHVLQIAGVTEQPDVDVHIGTLAQCPHCEVTFDLVPAHRING
jgi:hypothetical protein